MSHQWDEFSKSLAEESLPRRESLRRFGVVIAGAVLGPLGMESALAGRRVADPCKSFCRCRRKAEQNQCLAACRACQGVGQLCGGCGNYYCADLEGDFHNCGACGRACEPPGPWETGACLFGECWYQCVDGAVYCDGACTFLGWDPYNCGACGNVCPESAPYCDQGECTGCPPGTALCDGQCVNLLTDPSNCGACGNVCGGPNPSCYQGACSHCTGYCLEGWCGGDGCGGVCACPSGTYCESNWCYSDCPFPFILCGGVCVDPTSDPFNCGGCFNQCAPSEACVGGFCESGG